MTTKIQRPAVAKAIAAIVDQIADADQDKAEIRYLGNGFDQQIDIESPMPITETQYDIMKELKNMGYERDLCYDVEDGFYLRISW